ncbi:MAG: NAD(+)/NADH kinase [Candidatus Heimdallarchaeaceae archaeon]
MKLLKMHLLSRDSCILITSSSQEEIKKLALASLKDLEAKGFTVFLDSFLAKEVDDEHKVCFDDIINFIFVFGGDGTILKTFSKWKNIPILGINCGRVGFLTEIAPQEFPLAVKKLEKGEYFIEKYNTLSISTATYPTLSAANDLVVTSDKVGQIISLKVEINDQYLYTLNGDGVIVSTCVGSSAYSLSAGGSLLMPNVNAFSLVPICPFSRHIIPMVASLDTEIKITNVSKYRAGNVIIDGKMYYSLGNNESVIASKSEEKISFIRFSNNYVPRVREKLIRYDPNDFVSKG